MVSGEPQAGGCWKRWLGEGERGDTMAKAVKSGGVESANCRENVRTAVRMVGVWVEARTVGKRVSGGRGGAEAANGGTTRSARDELCM